MKWVEMFENPTNVPNGGLKLRFFRERRLRQKTKERNGEG